MRERFDLTAGPDAAALAADVRDRFPGVPVWAVDADGQFARPGPRLVDGVEALAAILHPDAGSGSGVVPGHHVVEVGA